MGDVQSGKTATYTALTRKAADAGYRLIILLTGTLENLRRQTQERLDMGFVGLDSSGWLVARERRTSEVGVGEIPRTIPEDWQSVAPLEIRQRMEEEGFPMP